MTTASTVSSNTAAKESMRDARDGLREVGETAAAASGDLQNDLKALRDDFGRLAEQVGDILANRGNIAWERAKAGLDGVVADAQDKGRDAVGAVRDVSDNFVEAIDESLKKRPYTTLAIVAGLGFLFGATWKR